MTDVERLRNELEGLLVKFNERLTGEPHSLNVLVAGRFLVANFESAIRADERDEQDRAWLRSMNAGLVRGADGLFGASDVPEDDGTYADFAEYVAKRMGYTWRDGAWSKEAQT
jgi:hypothetical protein